MKIKSLLCAVALILGVLIVGAPAKAQDGKISLFGGYSYGTNNLCGNFGCLDPGLHGYSIAATYKFNEHIGLEANFSGHNGSPTIESEPAVSTSNGFSTKAGEDIYSYTFGPKVSLPVGNFSLFTHFLVGGGHVHAAQTEKCIQAVGGSTCDSPSSGKFSGSGMAFKTGAGLDWNHGRWGLRILEVDFVRDEAFITERCTSCTQAQPDSFNAGANNFELATGVTFNFGKK